MAPTAGRARDPATVGSGRRRPAPTARQGAERVAGPATSPWSALGNRARGRVLDQGVRRTSGALTRPELGSQPDPYVRAILQSAVGRDLGDVRVRSGASAAAVLGPLGVDALAQRGEISIRREHDRPETLPGRALLLHELVHVLQQSEGSQVPGEGARSAEDLEEQARSTSIELAARPPLPARQDDAPA